jgi:transposase
MLDMLKELSCPVVAVMESTSTYGDAIRYQLRQLGFEVHQASAKRVHDAKEVHDGVPSLHDAKAASIIEEHYRLGYTKPWEELTDEARKLNALRREYDIHQSQYQRNQGRMEAFLSRHWPEVTSLLKLNSVTLESLLIKYGSPHSIAVNAVEAAQFMRKTGKHLLSLEKINQVIVSAQTTLGQSCLPCEAHFFQALATEMAHSRLQAHQAKKALEASIESDEELSLMGLLIGRVTTAILMSLHLDPRQYDCARSFQKALGLNLKEKSSGRYKGQLKLTKRGSAMARKYLYFAALRLMQSDPVIKQWYKNKTASGNKMKTTIALVRKLSKALWYVARGEKFDANKLFSVPAKQAA